VLSVNGLYRHGFLLTPTIVEEVLARLARREPSMPVGPWPCLRDTRAVNPSATVYEEVPACS
jgi:hypothetical protein